MTQVEPLSTFSAIKSRICGVVIGVILNPKISCDANAPTILSPSTRSLSYSRPVRRVPAGRCAQSYGARAARCCAFFVSRLRYGVPSLGPRTGPSAAAAVADPRYRSLPQLMPEHKANHEPRFHQVPPGEATRISAQAICPFEPDAPQPARRDRGNAGEVFDARARGPDGVDLETVQV